MPRFSTRNGFVLAVNDGEGKISIAFPDGSRPYTWRVKPGSEIFVTRNDTVHVNQVIAATVPPLCEISLFAQGNCLKIVFFNFSPLSRAYAAFHGTEAGENSRTNRNMNSKRQNWRLTRKRTFTLGWRRFLIWLHDAAIPPKPHFADYLRGVDHQTQLEAVIALGETGTAEAVPDSFADSRYPHPALLPSQCSRLVVGADWVRTGQRRSLLPHSPTLTLLYGLRLSITLSQSVVRRTARSLKVSERPTIVL